MSAVFFLLFCMCITLIKVAEKYQAQIEKLQQQHSAQISELLLPQKKKSAE